MGVLYNAVQTVERLIQERGLDDFSTKGAINLEAGFFISLVNPDTPDDPERLVSLRHGAEKVLNCPMPF